MSPEIKMCKCKSCVEHNPEREIDRCAEQVQHDCIKGSVPVHHGQGEDDQLGQTLQQKNTDCEIDFVRTFTLKVRSTNARTLSQYSLLINLDKVNS